MTAETRRERMARGQRMADAAGSRKIDTLVAFADVAITRGRTGQDNQTLIREAAQRHALDAVRDLRTAIIEQAGDPSWTRQVDLSERAEHLDVALGQLDDLGGPDDGYRTGGRLFHDTLAESRGDKAATARLKGARAVGELRALGLGGSGDTFVPPLYQIGQFADIPRPERVFAALVPTSPLGKGWEVNIPVLSASTGVQTTGQNVAPTESDPVDAYTTAPVSQQAGILTVSQQLFDQGWTQAHEDLASVTLGNAFDGDLETQLLAGSGSGGQVRGLIDTVGITTQTWTTSTPTAAELAQQIGAAIGSVATGRQKLPTAIIMTATRWAWLATGVDNQSRPLVNMNGDPRKPAATATTPVGTVGGVPVYVSSGVPANLGAGTNQDVIFVTRPEDHRAWTTPTSLVVNEAVDGGELSVVITLRASIAFLGSRYPTATAVITGTGLTTPVFA